MKNLVVVILLIFLVASCNKNENNRNSGIIIKGRISAVNKKGIDSRSLSSIPLTDAKKVFVVNLDNGMLRASFTEITNGTFAATSELGKATALVFLDANNHYIGTLSNRELNLLPLNNLNEGENTTIDLADLSLTGSSVVPSHDPFGKEILITDDEISRLKKMDSFFESLAKNIDANNDNVPDAMIDRQLFLKTRFWMQAGHWGTDAAAPRLSSIDTANISYQAELHGDKGFNKPVNIGMSGPAGDPYTGIETTFIKYNDDNAFMALFSRSGGLFKQGTYTMVIEGNPYTLNYSNMEVRRSLLFVLPTLHTNNEGKVTSITLEYRLPDGTTIDPVNILTDLMIQFNDDLMNQYFNSPWLRNESSVVQQCNCVKGVFSFTPSAPVDVSRLNRVTITYNDLLGNTYFINWNK